MITNERKQIVRIELDIAVDPNDKEDWREFIALMDDYGLEEKVLIKNGPGGGWPLVEIVGPMCSIEAYLLDHYANDRDELQEIMKTAKPVGQSELFESVMETCTPPIVDLQILKRFTEDTIQCAGFGQNSSDLINFTREEAADWLCDNNFEDSRRAIEAVMALSKVVGTYF